MDFNNQDSLYKLALNMIPGIGNAGVRKIVSGAESEQHFFENLDYYVETKLISQNIANVIQTNNILDLAKVQIETCLKHHIKASYYLDNDFPRKLAQCEDAPTMLFSYGTLNFDTSRTVGIVGTRMSDADGKTNIFNLVEGLKNDNINVIIISGLAAGADTYAHQAALKFGVPTAAVLGHGLNMVYPAENRKLAGDIVHNNGALVTEYYYGRPVNKANFPCRNRIIAGLCDALIVAQSKIKGGALITAEDAAEYKREVFAFPGRISDKLYAGCNYLISNNKATLVTSAADLERSMGWQSNSKKTATQASLNLVPLTPDEIKVIDTLRSEGQLYIDILSIKTGIPMAKLSSLLLMMEFKDLINSYPGKKYEAR
ncbi:MAG: DNA-processing protein DprA [Bacteroidales bacterium]|nr:DNA-processing protein DprA [Bacteroidales bacterium]